jgi:hypothetical protein
MNDDLGLNTDFDDLSVDDAAFARSVQEQARDEYEELGSVSLLVELKRVRWLLEKLAGKLK